MSKFTPGPWRIGTPGPNGCYTVGTKRGLMTAMITHSINHADQAVEATANANLIAAAPDLLEACQTFAEWLRRESAGSTNEPWAGKRDTPEGEAAWREWYDENLRICDLAQEQVRAAIAKATGETP